MYALQFGKYLDIDQNKDKQTQTCRDTLKEDCRSIQIDIWKQAIKNTRPANSKLAYC